jgi:hypothetical protein
VLYLPEDPRYRMRLVCLREDYLLSTKSSAALKTAETSTDYIEPCKLCLSIKSCGVPTPTAIPTGDQERGVGPSRSPRVEERWYFEPARDMGIAQSVCSSAMGGTDPMRY